MEQSEAICHSSASSRSSVQSPSQVEPGLRRRLLNAVTYRR
ncbi:hypothetical protein RISK_001700 [Rhodopirellula islandica]|uniref:Uncharacterized protein n=1 Tax=Rhodopirellula islandica TaxID=595434 RepID=A0A0J1ELT8_RHOIS|nr:hypothetical protein RISK_001700 [Rhodopirellula islandica]